MLSATAPPRLVVCAVLLLIMAATHTAMAFPFGANSGVTELTPATINQFLNTHKPVYIVFYAPWCGHCKSIHPEWEKFAKSVKDVVRVGAVNADAHKELGSKFGIQGFPTIKYWKMGNKKNMQPTDYTQARKAGAMQSSALAEIHSKGITVVSDAAAVGAALTKATSGKAILLFTTKSKSPPIFSVLSQSPHFAQKVAFLMAPAAAKQLAASMGVEKLPTIMLVSSDTEAEAGYKTEVYTGNIDYTSIAKYLQSALGVAENGGDAGAGSTKKETDATEEEAPAKKKETKRSAPKAASPVRPVPLVPHMFAAYCGQGSQKIRDQQPLCVVSFGNLNLDDLYSKFGNEAFLFFDATDASEHTRQQLTEQLQLTAELKEGDTLLIRAFKADACKYHVISGATQASVDEALQKAAGGELTMKKGDKFVSLTSSQE